MFHFLFAIKSVETNKLWNIIFHHFAPSLKLFKYHHCKVRQYKMQKFFENIYSEATDSVDGCNHAASLLKIFATVLGMFESNKDNVFSLNEIERMIADQQRPIPPRADVILILEMLTEQGKIKKWCLST